MNKLPLIAVAALFGLGIAASAVPASAATIASCRDDVHQSQEPNGSFSRSSVIDDNAANIMSTLREKGVNVQDISDWQGCVKADIIKPNGQTAMEFFDPSSLQRLSRG